MAQNEQRKSGSASPQVRAGEGPLEGTPPAGADPSVDAARRKLLQAALWVVPAVVAIHPVRARAASASGAVPPCTKPPQFCPP